MVERSWATISVGAAVAASFVAAGWTIFQNEFTSIKETATADRNQTSIYYNANKDELVRVTAELKARLTALEERQAMIISKMAHDPVEDRTFQAVIAAFGKQLDQTQQQIADINRQIAAAIIIIDQNSGLKRTPALPP